MAPFLHFKANSIRLSPPHAAIFLSPLPLSSTYKDPLITLGLLGKLRIISPSQGQLFSNLTPICNLDSPWLFNLTCSQFLKTMIFGVSGRDGSCGGRIWRQFCLPKQVCTQKHGTGKEGPGREGEEDTSK